MRIVASKHIEDCFDGSLVYEVSFDEPMTKPFIMSLAIGSKLQYFADFARPFFRIIDANFVFKGVQGNRTMRVISYQPFMETLATIENRGAQQEQHISF